MYINVAFKFFNKNAAAYSVWVQVSNERWIFINVTGIISRTITQEFNIYYTEFRASGGATFTHTVTIDLL